MQTKLVDKKTPVPVSPPHKDWRGMPEFQQEKQECFSAVVVRFETEEDLKKFAKLVNQKLTKKTKSIWYPAKSHWGTDIWRWIDES